jgi:hypothetical protein
MAQQRRREKRNLEWEGRERGRDAHSHAERQGGCQVAAENKVERWEGDRERSKHLSQTDIAVKDGFEDVGVEGFVHVMKAGFVHVEQVQPGAIWTFEQEQSLAFTNVATTVRMAAVKLRSGGLMLFSAIAPTEYDTFFPPLTFFGRRKSKFQ